MERAPSASPPAFTKGNAGIEAWCVIGSVELPTSASSSRGEKGNAGFRGRCPVFGTVFGGIKLWLI